MRKKKQEYMLAYMESPMGELMMASDGTSIKGLWFKEQKYFASEIERNGTVQNDAEVFAKADEWLQKYFAGERPDPGELPLDPDGSDFRKEVWDILLSIPYGETLTYGQIGEMIARERGIDKMSAQAVGGAVGHNPISIIIPCHRVIGRDGSLTGYAGGLDVKKQLLTLEGHEVDENYMLEK